MTESRGAKKKVLILDDEPSVVAYLETLLQDNGYETISARDGKEGFEKAKSQRPDLVTLDISMPQQSGIRFFRDLKDDPELRSTPVVVVTAVTGYGGDPDGFKRFLSTRKQIPPPEAFIAKPIDQKEFLDTIGKLLA